MTCAHSAHSIAFVLYRSVIVHVFGLGRTGKLSRIETERLVEVPALLFLFVPLGPGPCPVLVEALHARDLEAVGDFLLRIVAVTEGLVEKSPGMALFEGGHDIFAFCSTRLLGAGHSGGVTGSVTEVVLRVQVRMHIRVWLPGASRSCESGYEEARAVSIGSGSGAVG